ncbi:MAG: threonine ammonia-lyase [Clostridiales Family XIII bacterium]|jgi:threonine dehydratase|nr:threonine ammonia-lyase [Clostridiales Family XIII bacterium]
MNKSEINKYLKMDAESQIRKAAITLQRVLRKTPLIPSDFFREEYGANVFLKPEHLQVTGSFKIRGAYNKIANLSKENLSNGVIASSAGNHAQGVAFSAKERGVRATIVMPQTTPLIKVDATKAYGAKVILHGDIYDESFAKAKELSKEYGSSFIHPFDDYDVICGQGTIGLEVLEELPNVDEILVPVGGGGLIAGIALIAKSVNPKVKIIGVEPKGAMSMRVSLKEGAVTNLASVKTNAEGVAVRRVGDLSFAIAQRYLDDMVSVSEKDIMENVLLTMEKHKFVVETAGVVPLAAVRKRAKPGKNIVCILSGGNIDTVTLSSIINEGMISRGRIMCFSVELPDRPGQLVKVASLLAENNANVIELEHNQFKALDRYSNKVVLEVTVETNGREHIEQVLDALTDADFAIKRIY